MAGFLTSPSASLTTGTKLITISGNVDCSFVVSGTAVYLNNILMEGVSGTSPDPSGNSTITLRNNYTGSSIVNGTLVAFNTIEGLRDAIQRARELAATQVTNNSQLDIFLTNATTSVDLELPSGTVTVSPYQYISGLVLGNDVKQYAMSQAQFEAIREQNKEKYAASGFVHFGSDYGGAAAHLVAINKGLWTDSVVSNVLRLGLNKSVQSTGSKTSQAAVDLAGVLFYLEGLNDHGILQATIKFPQAPDGKTTYNKSTGVVTTHATVTAAFNAQAADPTNVEVVIDRVDMWGFETWLEEVNTTNPYVYQNGLIQSQAATMDGISTSSSNRPITYYAVFDGDTGSKGKGLNFFVLTDAQKKKVLANPKNNLYYLDDGRLVQWRLRVRSFVGAGNGDWEKIDSMVGDSLKVNSKLNITAQGQLDYRDPFVLYDVGANSYRSSVDTLNYKKNIGVYTVLYTSYGTAVNEECHFLVCGTVNRLNSGFYHPSLNASGSVADSTGKFWYNTALSFTTQAHCFDLGKISYD